MEKNNESLLSTRVSDEVHDQIREYCNRNGVLIKKFIETVSTVYISRYEIFNSHLQSQDQTGRGNTGEPA
jgi:hypothetical protein